MKILVSKQLMLLGILVGVCLSVALCIGFARFLDTPTADRESEIDEGLGMSTTNLSRVSDQTVNLQKLLRSKSPHLRRKNLHAFLFGKGSAELLTLIDESEKITTDRDKFLVQNTLFGYLARIDPKQALNNLWRKHNNQLNDLLAVVFNAWASVNLEEAVREAAMLEGSHKTLAIQTILLRRSDLTNTERNKIAQTLSSEIAANRVNSETKARQLLERPREAWNLVLADDINDKDQVALLVQIASAWINLDGSDGYPILFQELQRFEDEYGNSLASTIVQHVAARDPQGAWARMPTLSYQTQSSIFAAIMTVWGANDRQQAFKVLSSMKDSELRQAGYTHVLLEWASTSPSEVLDSLHLIPLKHRKEAVDSALLNLARQKSVDVAIQYLQGLRTQGEDVVDASRWLIHIWSQRDPTATLVWMAKNGKAESGWNWQGSVWKTTLARLALEDSVLAMEFARANKFFNASSEDMQYWVIEALASNGRFEAASAAINVVEEPVDLRIYFAVGKNLLDFDRADDAIELARKLPVSSWADYYSNLAQYWFYTNPDQLVNCMSRLPSNSVRSTVARSMIDFAKSDDEVLSLKQLEYLRTLVVVDEEK